MGSHSKNTANTKNTVSPALFAAIHRFAWAVCVSSHTRGKQGQRWALEQENAWAALKALGAANERGWTLSPAQDAVAFAILDGCIERWERLSARAKAGLNPPETESAPHFSARNRKARTARKARKRLAHAA